MSAENLPLVSVIIPMYNSAKFIPQTLESLLYQTMKDFEVVVVDDCSPDNSVEVVEGFKARFDSGGGGVQLHVLKLPKHTGTAALPRNIGIQFAHGKYIAFLDSDDLYTLTALEELTTLAEKYQADAVHMEDFFILWGGKGKSVDAPAFTDMKELTNPANFSKARNSKFRPDKPYLETNDLAERVKKLQHGGYSVFPFMTFYRRDFLITNEIFFPNIRLSEDQPFAFHGMVLAKKLLRVPNINCICRPRKGSLSRESQNMDAKFHQTMRTTIDGFKELVRIMNKIPFFNEHMECRYAVFDWFIIDSKVRWLQPVYEKTPSYCTLNVFIEREFQSEDAALSAYLFNTVNIQRLQIMRLQQELAKFHKQ